MLLPLCRPLKIAWVVIAGFFELRLCATMFAETNWPRDSFGFACFAASYALWSASGMTPSFAAIPLNESLLFPFGAAFAGVDGFAFDGCDIGRTWVVGFPCARTALAAARVRLAATAIPITTLVIGFMHSSSQADIPTAGVVLPWDQGLPQARKRHVARRRKCDLRRHSGSGRSCAVYCAASSWLLRSVRRRPSPPVSRWARQSSAIGGPSGRCRAWS